MLSLIPVICFLLLFLALLKHRICDNLRAAFLASTLLWGLIVTLTTEGLSIFRAIDRSTLIVAWVVYISITLLFLTYPRNRKIEIAPTIDRNFLRTHTFEISLLLPIASIVILIGVVAWFAPPNSYDSMTYHMSRVVHWIQNRSVAHYPTNIIFQLHQNPWSETAILHFMILSGNDKFANLIQWFSMGGSILGITLITKQLGGNFRAQVFAAICCATIPMGILQGSSTQTDYVLSYWLVCVLYFAIMFRRNPNSQGSILLGISLGLAVLTKATAYIYAFPIILWISFSVLKTGDPKKLYLLVIITCTAIAINLGHYTRNYNLYGNPLGPMADFNTRYTNDLISVPSVISNLSRNLALHIATPMEGINTFLEEGILRIHRIIGFSANDPRTTWPGTEFHLSQFLFHEDHAGNPVHLILIGFASILLLSQRHYTEEHWVVWLLLAGFILFCVFLKWQPWNSRLHLPLFVLGSAFIGLMFSRLKVDLIANAFSILLLVVALPWILANPSRPLLGNHNIFTVNRAEQYFLLYPTLLDPYRGAVNFVKDTSCADVGLITGENDFEYPFWVFFNEPVGSNIRLEHLNVTNPSRVLSDLPPYASFSPCALLVTKTDQPDRIEFGEVFFKREWRISPVSVYLRME